MTEQITTEPAYWIAGSYDPESGNNPAWVALVSEEDGGIIAVGRADVMEACAEALNATPDDWEEQ